MNELHRAESVSDDPEYPHFDSLTRKALLTELLCAAQGPEGPKTLCNACGVKRCRQLRQVIEGRKPSSNSSKHSTATLNKVNACKALAALPSHDIRPGSCCEDGSQLALKGAQPLTRLHADSICSLVVCSEVCHHMILTRCCCRCQARLWTTSSLRITTLQLPARGTTAHQLSSALSARWAANAALQSG